MNLATNIYRYNGDSDLRSFGWLSSCSTWRAQNSKPRFIQFPPFLLGCHHHLEGFYDVSQLIQTTKESSPVFKKGNPINCVCIPDVFKALQVQNILADVFFYHFLCIIRNFHNCRGTKGGNCRVQGRPIGYIDRFEVAAGHILFPGSWSQQCLRQWTTNEGTNHHWESRTILNMCKQIVCAYVMVCFWNKKSLELPKEAFSSRASASAPIQNKLWNPWNQKQSEKVLHKVFRYIVPAGSRHVIS